LGQDQAAPDQPTQQYPSQRKYPQASFVVQQPPKQSPAPAQEKLFSFAIPTARNTNGAKSKQSTPLQQNPSSQQSPADLSQTADVPSQIATPSTAALRQQALLKPTSAVQNFIKAAAASAPSSSLPKAVFTPTGPKAPANPYLTEALIEFKPKFTRPDNC